MSVPVMVDSSWYIEQASQGHDPLRVLASIAESRDIATCGVIKAEVGRGLRESRFLERYRAAWDAMLYVPSDHGRWEKTLELARLLDQRGIHLPLQEVHIATCALTISAVVLTYNSHFQKIPGLAATDRIY
ncbi:MAG: putative nucleic acid-binding protein [Verrucomicrobiales bacterium]|jgi:predicted nucleic acid-binding protein